MKRAERVEVRKCRNYFGWQTIRHHGPRTNRTFSWHYTHAEALAHALAERDHALGVRVEGSGR